MTDKERREKVVSELLPFYLKRFHSRGNGDQYEVLARVEAFRAADRLIRESDTRERQGL